MADPASTSHAGSHDQDNQRHLSRRDTGNTLGVTIAGAAIAAGLGLRIPAVTGAILTVIGLGLVLAARVAGRKARS